jgi:hypothetical protein
LWHFPPIIGDTQKTQKILSKRHKWFEARVRISKGKGSHSFCIRVRVRVRVSVRVGIRAAYRSEDDVVVQMSVRVRFIGLV